MASGCQRQRRGVAVEAGSAAMVAARVGRRLAGLARCAREEQSWAGGKINGPAGQARPAGQE